MTIIHDVQQGSTEWHALRNRVKHTASDLAAIRGNSKYKTRAQAVREAATGIKPEVSEFQQKKFDEGHATEAKARVIVEQMIGEDLYPSTATTDDEYLLASSDGATMLSDTGHEHKLWNEDIAAQIRASIESNACQLHPMYTDQMDQQIAVYGFERIIFVTSDGTPEKMESYEYRGNPESIARIRADWAQFDEDVANYQPEVIEAKPILTANPIDNLPALVIEVTGRVTHSNLVEFKAAANAVISSIKTELVTDQDFVDAIDRVKYLKNVVDKAKNAKQNTLDQTESIAIVHKSIDDVIKMATDVRLALEKKFTEEKDSRKAEIVITASRALGEHFAALGHRVGVPVASAASFGDAIKGLKSIDSMRDKVSAALANAKIDANAVADRIDANIKSLEGEGHSWRFLFPDLAAVCTKAHDDFAALLAARQATHKEAEAKRLEAERERIRAEEQAKALREANEKAAAEIRRLDAERRAAAMAEAEKLAAEAKETMVKNSQQIEESVASAVVTGLGISQFSAGETGHVDVKNIATEQVIDRGATLKLGEINARLGVVSVTAEQLERLGVKPVATDKNAKLYSESSFPTICRLISDHVLALAFKKAA